jgi:predicted nuclease of predicted toxin-antitoxin system
MLKIIWLRVGKWETRLITNLLRFRYQLIRQFIESETESLTTEEVVFKTEGPPLKFCS